MAQKEYMARHAWVGKAIHWEMCKKFKFNHANKCNWCSWYSHRRINKGTGWLGHKTTRGDHPNFCIIEIGQNTEKSPEDLRRLAVTQTDCKSSDGEAPALDIYEIQSTLSFPLLPDPLWPKVVAPDSPSQGLSRMRYVCKQMTNIKLW